MKSVRLYACVAMALLMLADSCNAPRRTQSRDDRLTAYLAAFMTGSDQEHMYYAVADGKDGIHFKMLNGGQPVLDAHYDDCLIRDPHLFLDQDGIWHVVATVSWTNAPFTIWDSKDLIHWTDERLVNVAPENSTKTWAPELAYDPESDQYFAYWTGEVGGDWSTASIYYSTTRDFHEWSAPKILLSEEDGILDADIIRNKDGRTYIFYRRENSICFVSSDHSFGPWSDYRKAVPTEDVEGPYVFEMNGGAGYGLVFDYFRSGAGFGLFHSDDLENWTAVTNEEEPLYNGKISFPDGIRHGSIVGITQEEYDALVEAFPF